MTNAIEAERSSSQSVAAFALGALGVIFGDIGTSPLYTFKTALSWGVEVRTRRLPSAF
jgi:KUP system potassium uptake protein